jgi:hypothetical protein
MIMYVRRENKGVTRATPRANLLRSGELALQARS